MKTIEIEACVTTVCASTDNGRCYKCNMDVVDWVAQVAGHAYIVLISARNLARDSV